MLEEVGVGGDEGEGVLAGGLDDLLVLEDVEELELGAPAVLRGAELAATESDNFGIDHPTVGALWIETIGFPQAVADTIRKAAQLIGPQH